RSALVAAAPATAFAIFAAAVAAVLVLPLALILVLALVGRVLPLVRVLRLALVLWGVGVAGRGRFAWFLRRAWGVCLAGRGGGRGGDGQVALHGCGRRRGRPIGGLGGRLFRAGCLGGFLGICRRYGCCRAARRARAR